MAYIFWLIAIARFCQKFVNAGSCPNRQYCDDTEIKYRSFSVDFDSFLNSKDHTIKTIAANSTQTCMQECTRTPGCQSGNHFQPSSPDGISCDLINANKWSNASLYQTRIGSTHFFVKSPCSSNPCKNNGTCISLDQDNTYQCTCAASSNTVKISGTNCEIRQVGKFSSDVLFSFDQIQPRDVKSSASRVITTQGKASVVRVPSKTATVFYLPGLLGSYAFTRAYSSECIMDITACATSPNNGLTVSFWFKLFKRSQERFDKTSCSASSVIVVQSCSTVDLENGFIVQFYGCQENAMRVWIRDGTTKLSSYWGNTFHESKHKTWNHFMFTYQKSNGLFLYHNGLKVSQQTSPTTFEKTGGNSTYLQFGRNGLGNFEMYIDDFAVWYNFFTPEDALLLYNRDK